MSVRYLGVDLGTKRIGLAVADDEMKIASPIGTVQAGSRSDDNADMIIKAAHDYDAGAIVVGLPLNMDGTEGVQAKSCKKVAEAIQRATAGRIAVYLYDERLTSHAADGRLRDRELTRKQKKSRQDAVAAQILIESFLESRSKGAE